MADAAPEELAPLPRPEELNRVLIVLEALAMTNDLSFEVLETAASQFCLGSHLPEVAATARFAAEVGLVGRRGERIALTDLGRALLAVNPERTYEITTGQRRFLATHCLFVDPYRRIVEAILSHFRLDPARGSLTCDLGTLKLNGLEVSAVSFMRTLNIIQLDGDIAVVAPEHRPAASLLSRKRSMSPEQLQDLLNRRQAQGTGAEQFVLEWERSRLRSLECEAEADAVLHVSELDVCAGYDISSFDGKSRSFAFDRFVEVKSTTGAEPQFILSRNELEVARALGKHYWLYVVCRFGMPGITPTIWTLRDPAREIKQKFDLQCLEFRGTLKARPIKTQRAT